MERWRHHAAFGGIHGRCRVHRAELLRLRPRATWPSRRRSRRAWSCARGCAASTAGRWWSSAPSGCAGVTSRQPRRRSERRTACVVPAARAGAAAPGPGDVGVALTLITEAIERPVDEPFEGAAPVRRPAVGPAAGAQVEIAVGGGRPRRRRRGGRPARRDRPRARRNGGALCRGCAVAGTGRAAARRRRRHDRRLHCRRHRLGGARCALRGCLGASGARSGPRPGGAGGRRRGSSGRRRGPISRLSVRCCGCSRSTVC